VKFKANGVGKRFPRQQGIPWNDIFLLFIPFDGIAYIIMFR
jgi:hypothetical protein